MIALSFSFPHHGKYSSYHRLVHYLDKDDAFVVEWHKFGPEAIRTRLENAGHVVILKSKSSSHHGVSNIPVSPGGRGVAPGASVVSGFAASGRCVSTRPYLGHASLGFQGKAVVVPTALKAD